MALWPDGTDDDLIAPSATDYMDDPGFEGDVVVQKLVNGDRRFIAEFGANPSGAYTSLSERLDGLLDTHDGGTITGPVVLTGADAFLTLAVDPTDVLQAVPKQYLDAVVNALFPGGIVAGTPNDGDAWVYRASDGKWHLTATGL